MKKWSVVVPSNRPEKFDEFQAAWQRLFAKHDVNLIPVRDEQATWDEMPDFIPRRTDMIRSWGIYRAWQAKTEYTLTFDDDVRPPGEFDPFVEYERQFDNDSVCSPYLSVGSLTTSSLQMRGFPYEDRKPAPVVIQYGGWHGVLDYDASTQLASCPRAWESFERVVVPVPRGAAVTCCIMNAAWRTEFAPLMWQLPLLDGKYNRFGDIWSGLLQKKILDVYGLVMLINGRASVVHSRASNSFANLEREAPGCRINEGLWEALSGADGSKFPSLGEAYRAYSDRLAHIEEHDQTNDYARHFIKSREAWLALYGW